MSRRAAALAAALLCLAFAALLPGAAAAAAAPAWTLTLRPMPAAFAPGSTGEYLAIATNVGAAPTSGTPSVVEVTLPPGIAATEVEGFTEDPAFTAPPGCVFTPQAVTCETNEALHPGRWLMIRVKVGVTAAGGMPEAHATVSGGGASQTVETDAPTAVQAGPPSFDFQPGFGAPISEEDGTPAVVAGSHPYQQTVLFGFPTESVGEGLTNAGHPRDFFIELPRGMVGQLGATPVLCTEAELTTPEGCPKESQVGLTDVNTLVGKKSINAIFTTNLYSMVPPPGSPAEFATDVANVGIYVHVLPSVRSDGDYGIEAGVHDVLAFGQQPIFGVQTQLWGDPSAAAHDRVRGECTYIDEACPEIPQKTAFLTLPTDCPAERLPFEALADTWEEPFPEFDLHRTRYESADLTGNPVTVQDCGALDFEPTIEAKPTTNVADSPAGLDFNLHQPQDTDVGSRSTANLRDAAITFPAGLAVNASQAAGLGACSEDQIGFDGEDGEGVLHFSKEPQSCPDAAKLGTVSVTSPVLVRRNSVHKVERDSKGNAILETLHGAVYLAQPFANPFGSLVAVYLVVEDPKTGTVAKLAGEGELDPGTGQLTTYFEENPELPLEDVNVHLFGGPRGAFVTPPVCGKFTASADLVPWSSPEGPHAFPESSFETTAAPGGGACATSEAQLPNAPRLQAGTSAPSAGAYSPLLFKLSREDGSQRLAKIEATLPTGLSAKLAGVGTCSEADIAKARSREAPQQGALEQADPSCPSSSEIGVVNAAAGAGPNPYYTQGHAYLAGPYKGAPLSVVAIAPAIAGPFDLGTVVVRSALYLDPSTAQGRIVSDPLPTILHGVPIDLRSVAVRAERPNFTLNPTSCAEKSFGGSATSTLGLAAPLFERFQVGGCSALAYGPKMSARLYGPIHRGGHPRLRAVFTAKPGEANTAAISFTFPHSEFIDQSHFRTICTRVQFAAAQCPAGSIYGHVRAFTPLLDYPLEGPAYLRSSNHKLPDLVLALRGPASQPIALEAVGRVDSLNGGLRVRFETVPDAPISKVIVTAQGGKKGLFQNSTNICRGTHRATLLLDAQNGKVHDTRPKVSAQCGKKGKGGRGGHRHHR